MISFHSACLSYGCCQDSMAFRKHFVRICKCAKHWQSSSKGQMWGHESKACTFHSAHQQTSMLHRVRATTTFCGCLQDIWKHEMITVDCLCRCTWCMQLILHCSIVLGFEFSLSSQVLMDLLKGLGKSCLKSCLI